MYQPQNPLIVQSDQTILLEVHSPGYTAARDGLAQFAELVKSPEHIHTYRITALSLWNAASSGLKAMDVLAVLDQWSKYDIPPNVQSEISEKMGRYGLVKMLRNDDGLVLQSVDANAIAEIAHSKAMQPFIKGELDSHTLLIDGGMRGHVKSTLIRLNFPVEDLAGYTEGTTLELSLRQVGRSGRPFSLREYQTTAVDTFWAGGAASGGSGIIVLPCGAGKTIVALGIMDRIQEQTLILTTNTVAARQWMEEVLDKTSIGPSDLGEYSGDHKSVCPVTVATYQMLTYRREKTNEFPHLK
ncbi:MAG: helicase-associated domain-containing protein, partial [Armatimonadota bacterium]|nr:helicase-associated domain-containing protein [Armatimonadota bacterium]